jgi:hypothetical protein
MLLYRRVVLVVACEVLGDDVMAGEGQMLVGAVGEDLRRHCEGCEDLMRIIETWGESRGYKLDIERRKVEMMKLKDVAIASGAFFSNC